MKNPILVDIDIITEYLKTGKGILPVAYEKYEMKITSSTYAELLASETFNDENLEKEVKDFVKKYFKIIPLDDEIANTVARILRQHDVSFASAIVAGTGIEKSLELLTNNKSDYEKIAGVTIIELE